MRSQAFHHWLVVQALICCLAATGLAGRHCRAAELAATADTATALADALRQLATGDPRQAAEALEPLIAADPDDLDMQTACTAAGQALSQLGDHAAATRYYLLAIEAADTKTAVDPADTAGAARAAVNTTTVADAAVLRIAAAGAALRCGQLETAIQQSRRVLQPPVDGCQPSSAEQRTIACRIAIAALMAANRLPEAVAVLQQADAGSANQAAALAESAEQLAARCLSQHEPAPAMAAYQWYLEHLPSGPACDRAELGVAWAAALGAEPPTKAAVRLESFADAYPDHADAPRAMRAAAACWQQAGEAERADQVRQTIIRRWPRTAASVAALDELAASHRDDRSDSVCQARRDLLLEPIADAPLAAPSIAAAIRDAAVADDQAYWDAAVQTALEHADNGPCIGDALQRLADADQEPAAERLAVQVLGELSKPELPAAAVEAVCDWAALSRRWSLLAMAAEEVDPTKAADAGLTAPAVGRIAEALVQTSRGKTAQSWLEVAVDRLQARDFANLVRRAELAVAFDSLDVADARVADAAEVADSADQQALLEMLRAEVSIRRAQLDAARETLERLVRSEQTAGELRCRAQWLIGETLLLQARPAEAIEAYRRVESMDPTGHWTAAALVQAGKAFEQLGRERDATLCYSALVQRFADSPHAATAHDRLAVIRDQPTRR